MAAYTLMRAPFSVFFGGGWQELIVSTCVGLAVGTIAFFMARLHVGRVAPSSSWRPRPRHSSLVRRTRSSAPIGGWIPLGGGTDRFAARDRAYGSARGVGQRPARRPERAGWRASASSSLVLTLGRLLAMQLAGILAKRSMMSKPHHLPDWYVLPALIGRGRWLVLAVSRGMSDAGSDLRRRRRQRCWARDWGRLMWAN